MKNFAITGTLRKQGEYKEFFGHTFIIWDLSFTQDWITEEVTSIWICAWSTYYMPPLPNCKISLLSLTRSSKKNQAYLKTDSLTMPVLTTICNASSSWKCYIINTDCWKMAFQSTHLSFSTSSLRETSPYWRMSSWMGMCGHLCGHQKADLTTVTSKERCW